jgi:4-amino-4-deoxy-L-arabinose transferase-like glycosyltransferase
MMSSTSRREKVILLGITALAAFFRLYRLHQIPPGFQFDQAYYALDALKLLQGEFAIFFHAPGKSEPLYQYLLMPGIALFGADSPLALKITSGIIGVLTIPIVYGITRAIFLDSSRRMQGQVVALLATFFTAISFWHIFYNRYGERIPLTLLWATLTYWFLWRALTQKQTRWRAFAFTGLFTGVTLYTYPSARVVPIAIVLLIAYALLTDRSNARDHLKGLMLIAAIAFIVFLPLGVYYLQNPNDFISHSAQVSIFVPHGAVSDNVPLELSKNALKLLGMFFVAGDAGVLRNLPYRPVFDPFVGGLFVVGVIAWVVQLFSHRSASIERLRAVFFVVWLGLALGLSLISDDAPNNGRILIGLPVVMMLPAWGAWEIWARLRSPILRSVAIGLMIVILSFNALQSYRDYFVVFANSPETYYAFDTDKVELSDWINRNAQVNQMFLAPLLAQNGTISLLTRYAPLKSFESRDTMVLPSRASGKDALMVFPYEQEKKIQTLSERLGSLGSRQNILGSNGGTLALVYRVPASNLPDENDPLAALARGGTFIQPEKIERANWGNLFELLGYTISPEGPGGRNLTATLFFRALSPMTEDYTFSIKVRDEKNRAWGQEDKWAGSNSYETTRWSRGDLVVEKFYPGLNACAPAGDYRITVEAYNPKTGAVLGLSDREGSSVALGALRAGASEGNRFEDLEPAQAKVVKISEQLRLMGYTLSSNELRVGDEFSLALFWRGVANGRTEQVTVRLRDAVLSESAIKIPAEGRGLCSFFDLTVPGNLAPGAASVSVNGLRIADVNLVK